MSTAATPISFEEFRSLIAKELQVEESQVVPEASFVQDLYADSIRMVELMLRLEETGIEIPFEEAWNVQTVGDAYQLYANHASQSPAPPPAES
jgi:acyl carrier protein